MEQCESRDNFDRYLYNANSGRVGSSGNGNSSQSKSGDDSKPTNKKPKREASDDDWSD